MKRLAISGEKDRERRISFSTKPPEILSDGSENGAFTHDQEPVSMAPIEEEDAAQGGSRGTNTWQQVLTTGLYIQRRWRRITCTAETL